MHFGAQFLQPLLVLDAEMLLLVDHDEAKVLEADRLAEQSMRADDDVDLARCEAGLDALTFGGSDHDATLARP